MIALAISFVLSTEALVIISNFVVAMTTLLLWSASLHEQHQTIKAIAKSDNSVIRFIVKAFKGTPKQ